jgi:hypothetical protein
MAPLSHDQRQAMADGLLRAARHLDDRANALDETVRRWRKNRPHDDSPIIAMTLHGVVWDLRHWADQCRDHPQSAKGS